jgi:transglutaminase-like putative cysteine protease
LLAGKGVCRDYAHLVVALLRAVKVPARLVSVYPPGLSPMDFHAVAEAFVEGQWRVVDATLLAPLQNLVRIATGRDAADTAFLDNHKGTITPNQLTVTAIVDGDLPAALSTVCLPSADDAWCIRLFGDPPGVLLGASAINRA